MKSLNAVINEAMNAGQFAEEKLNGFRFKNANYVLRYNRFEKRFELFEDVTLRGTVRRPMLVIKDSTEENGDVIVRYLQDKYAKGGRQLNYNGTVYGF